MNNMMVDIFKALGHPIRLEIINKLMVEEQCVCKLVDLVNFSQSNLSQHLNILKQAKIVKSSKKGMYTYYSIADKDVCELINIANTIVKKQIDSIREI